MKPLLNKTIKPFIIYILFILAISIPVYFFVIDAVWLGELDENNRIVVDKTVYRINQLKLSEEKLEESIKLWNEIQPSTNIQELKPNDNLKDTTFTVDRQEPYTKAWDVDRFRGLSTVIYINQKPYRIVTETNVEEIRDTIGYLTTITIFFFILMVVGLLLLTKKLSLTIWKPFYKTLEKLKIFNLNSQEKIEFEPTDVKEFKELNEGLTKMIHHSVSTYQSQKEFTENASHELQTPIAILKNKLDILLQDSDLTEKQYNVVEEMNRTLMRSSRINKNLLLLAKIENNQFEMSELISLDVLLLQSIEILQEHFDQKNIKISKEIISTVQINGNKSLMEALINNLLLNAIRYTPHEGTVRISLSESEFFIANSGGNSLNSDQLFKRFSKLSSDNEGSGLGLSIVQKICEFHKLEIQYKYQDNYHIFSIQL